MVRTAVHLIVRGRVQGVGYRHWTRAEARRLGLDGWVRNRSDGAVELVAAGPGAVVEKMVKACGRGPPSAEVTRVERFEADDDGFDGFVERPTV